jgi:hypothetical protein
MKEKLTSRKFLVTLAGVVTVIANDYFELGLNQETVFSVVSMVVGYVVGQGVIDAKKAVK